MDAVLAVAVGCVELEKAELNRSFGEGGMQVEHVVAAVVVMVVAAVGGVITAVPNVCKGSHRLGLSAIQAPEEIRVNRPAVPGHAVGVEAKGVGQKVFVAGHDVGEVPQGLRSVAIRSNVDVHSAAAGGVALGACLTKPSAKLLQGLDVLVPEDRGDQLRLFALGACYADVPGEFPLAAGGVPGAPGVVAVSVGGVLPAAGAKEFSSELCCSLPGDVIHLDLDPDGLRFHRTDLALSLVRHGLGLLKVLIFQGFSPSACVYITLPVRYIKTIRDHILHNDTPQKLCISVRSELSDDVLPIDYV